jgi:thymidylate synthase (FAD)
MKIVTHPTVRLFSYQVFNPQEDLPIPDDGDDVTKIGAFAAKTCYRSFGSEGRSNTNNQAKIIESGHGRILEHMVFGLHISGISRALGNELITHKQGITVSQESTRYVDMEDAGYVLEPYLADLFAKHKDALNRSGTWFTVGAGSDYYDYYERLLIADHLNSASFAMGAYEDQVENLLTMNPLGLEGTELRKWARGKARNLLPLGLETSLVMTGNLRAFRHFIEMRSERHAEEEIRRLAHRMFQTLQPLAPLYFDDYQVEEVRGIPEYVPTYRKV